MTTPSLTQMLANPVAYRKLLWLLVLATLVIATLIIVPLEPTKFPAVDSKIMALQMLFWLILPVLGLNAGLLRASSWRTADTAFAWILGAYGLSALFSGQLAYCLATTWHQAGIIALAWVAFRLRPDVHESHAFVRVIAVLGILCALYGFLTYFGKDILRPLYPFTYDERQGGRNFIHSFLGNPEYYAGYAAPVSIILLGLAFQPDTRFYYRLGWLGGAGFVLFSIILSGSRAALLGFSVGVVIQFFGQIPHMQKQIRRLVWVAAAGAVILGGIGVAILSTPNRLNPRDMRLIQRFAQITDTRSDSVRERLIFYTTTAAAIPADPIFGHGPGTYRLEFLKNIEYFVKNDQSGVTTVMLDDLNRRLAEHTHNDYLEIWFDQGTLGFGGFLFLIIHSVIRFVKTSWILARRKMTALASLGAIHASIFAAFFTMCLNALTSFPFQMPARSTLAWLLVGTFFAVDALLNSEIQQAEDRKLKADAG